MDILSRVIALLEEGTYGIILPLMAVCAAMWILVVERGTFLFGSPWSLFSPRERGRILELKKSLVEAIDEYIESPRREIRARIVRLAKEIGNPYGRFLVRVLQGPGLLESGRRGLQLNEASLRGSLEIERGLSLISTLAKAAPLMGLLGTVMGMIQTFSAMMVASTSDPRALSSGVSIALIATEVGLVVAMPGVVSMAWLSRRAQTLEEEISVVSMRLSQVQREENHEVFA